MEKTLGECLEIGIHMQYANTTELNEKLKACFSVEKYLINIKCKNKLKMLLKTESVVFLFFFQISTKNTN